MGRSQRGRAAGDILGEYESLPFFSMKSIVVSMKSIGFVACPGLALCPVLTNTPGNREVSRGEAKAGG